MRPARRMSFSEDPAVPQGWCWVAAPGVLPERLLRDHLRVAVVPKIERQNFSSRMMRRAALRECERVRDGDQHAHRDDGADLDGRPPHAVSAQPSFPGSPWSPTWSYP